MAETIEQVKKQIDEFGQEINRLVSEFMENVGNTTKGQNNTQILESIRSWEAKRTDLLKKLARLYHPNETTKIE